MWEMPGETVVAAWAGAARPRTDTDTPVSSARRCCMIFITEPLLVPRPRRIEASTDGPRGALSDGYETGNQFLDERTHFAAELCCRCNTGARFWRPNRARRQFLARGLQLLRRSGQPREMIPRLAQI